MTTTLVPNAAEDDATAQQIAGGNFFGGITAMMMTIENGYGHCGNGTEWCTENLISSLATDSNANLDSKAALDTAVTALKAAWTTLAAPPAGKAYCFHLTAQGPRLLLKVVNP